MRLNVKKIKLSIEKNRSKHTINSYENDLRNFINFLSWHKKNKNISLDELNLTELIVTNFEEYYNLAIKLLTNDCFYKKMKRTNRNKK